MAHFNDLTPYTYLAASRYTVEPVALNVGWLDKGWPRVSGPVPDAFIERLRVLCASPVNKCMGSHPCPLCPTTVDAYGIIRTVRGNGEIRVTHQGVTYAAPVLIHHYVERHQYRPPQVFIDAVLA